MDTMLEAVLLVVFFVAYPLYGWRTWEATRRKVAAGHLSRLSIFREVVLVQWGATALLAVLWWLAERGPEALALGWGSGPGLWRAWGLVALAVFFLATQDLMLRRSAEARQKFRAQLEGVDALIPRNGRELGGFAAASVTAGVCEELLYRGFLFWWFQGLGLGTVGAAILSTLAFGLAHGYQGWGGVLKTSLVGGAMMGLVLLAGSLWPAVVLHALVDLFGGSMGYVAFRDGGGDTAESAETPASDTVGADAVGSDTVAEPGLRSSAVPSR